MSNEIAKVNPQMAVAPVDEKTLRDYLFWLKDPINEKQQNMFLQIAKANNLNPFKREIYAVGFGDNFSIITGYQVYIDKANASWLLDGWEVETIKSDDGKVAGARVIIYRKDWQRPFKWEASVDEFAKQFKDKTTGQKRMMKNWAEMPEFMIKKVVIGQGFRLCFPSELWGLPYLAEEITANSEKDVINGQVVEVEEEKEDPKPTENKVDTVAKNEATEVETVEPIDLPQEDENNSKTTKLPTNKVKQVQIKWKEFAEKSGFNQETSERKRLATIKKYYDVESVNDMTVDQADDFVAKIDQAIEKIIY